MKTLLVAIALALCFLASAAKADEIAATPSMSATDAQLATACGKHDVDFIVRATGLHGYLRTDHTYYSTISTGSLTGRKDAVKGSWEIQGGQLVLTLTLPAEFGGQEKSYPFPLQIGFNGDCYIFANGRHLF